VFSSLGRRCAKWRSMLIQLLTHTSAHKRPISRPIHSPLCLLHETKCLLMRRE
jgi:hypothetical protein